MNCIYKITIAHKYYYGQTTDFNRRRCEHLSRLKQDNHCNRYMQRCFDKFDDFSMEVIATVTSAEHLDEVEQFYIDKHFDDVDCMNLARHVDSPTRGRKMGPHTAETKAKISAAKKGKKHTAETRAKISAANRGRKKPPRSAEHRAKLSAAIRRYCFGRLKGTEEWIKFESQTVAAEHVGGSVGNINNCIKGRRKTHKKWEWKS